MKKLIRDKDAVIALQAGRCPKIIAIQKKGEKEMVLYQAIVHEASMLQPLASESFKKKLTHIAQLYQLFYSLGDLFQEKDEETPAIMKRIKELKDERGAYQDFIIETTDV